MVCLKKIYIIAYVLSLSGPIISMQQSVECTVIDPTVLLFEAIHKGSQEDMCFALKNGADVNSISDTGDTPLTFALEKHHNALVEILLKQEKIDVNKSSVARGTPLQVAVCRNSEGVELLLKSGANPNIIESPSKRPIIFHAIFGGSKEIIQSFLKHGVDLNVEIWTTRYSLSDYCMLKPHQFAKSCGECAIARLLKDKYKKRKRND